MTLALAFWVIMLVWAVFHLGQWPWSGFVTFILLVLLGWRVFGAPFHG